MKISLEQKQNKKQSKEKNSVKGVVKAGFLSSLKAKLLVGFLIPVCFVAFVGIYAYQKASEGMLNNYETSTMQTIQMTTQYIDFGLEAIQADALQLYIDESMVAYALDQYKNDPVQASMVLDTCKKMLNMKKLSNEFVDNIHLITDKNVACITTAVLGKEGNSKGFYKAMKDEKGDVLTSRSSVDNWDGTHLLLNENFATGDSTYVCSHYRVLSTGNAAIVIDISRTKIEEILGGMNLGEGSRVAFITDDQRENLLGETEFSFLNQPYYTWAIENEDSSGYRYVTVDGEEYLFMYSKCATNDAVVCGMVPKSSLMAEAEELKTICTMLIILSCIVVLVIGMVIVADISKNMNRLTKRLSRVAEGDLTTDMSIRTKSEFGVLSNYMRSTIDSTKKLIMQAMDIASNVTDSVDEVSEHTKQLRNSMVGIENAVQEITLGSGQQAEDAEKCLHQMDALSELIMQTGEHVSEVQQLVADTGDKVVSGKERMALLQEKERETSNITGKVADWVEELLEKSKEIGGFVESINEIAEETTLLSLNASIEAARAGDAGRGFAVVAEQIKKLADVSLESSQKITEVVKDITDIMQETMKYSREAEKIVGMQDEIVAHTEGIFTDIYQCMDMIHMNVEKVSSSMRMMMEEREATLESIESISGVLEETAASSAYVKNMVSEQTEQVKAVEVRVEALKENTDQLTGTVNSFKVQQLTILSYYEIKIVIVENG